MLRARLGGNQDLLGGTRSPGDRGAVAALGVAGVRSQSAGRQLGAGDYFGEMGLIDHSYRSATITAETELRCLLFTAWVFRPFALEHPETAWALLEMMVRRVREAEAR